MVFSFAFRFAWISLCFLWLHFPMAAFSSLAEFNSCQHNNARQSLIPKLSFLVASPVGKANSKWGELSMKS